MSCCYHGWLLLHVWPTHVVVVDWQYSHLFCQGLVHDPSNHLLFNLRVEVDSEMRGQHALTNNLAVYCIHVCMYGQHALMHCICGCLSGEGWQPLLHLQYVLSRWILNYD